jgi:phosphatidate cytidylyltransferase
MLKTRFYSALVLIALTILVIVGPRFGGILFAGALCTFSLYELFNLVKPFNPMRFYPYALLIIVSCVGIGWMKFQLWPGDMWLLLTFLITWAHDTGGYIFGKIFEGKKIWASVSPNKTWSGLVGGIILGLFVNWICGLYVENEMPVLGFFTIIVLNFIGLGGDLIESKIKRLCQQKDSGSIIPGHGGILDRFDSFFTINLAMWALYVW